MPGRVCGRPFRQHLARKVDELIAPYEAEQIVSVSFTAASSLFLWRIVYSAFVVLRVERTSDAPAVVRVVVGLRDRITGMSFAWMLRWLVAVAVTPGAGALLPSSAVAGTGTLSISFRPTPAVGLPLSIRVSGKQLPVGDLVRVYLFSNATGCWIEEGIGQKLRAGGRASRQR